MLLHVDTVSFCIIHTITREPTVCDENLSMQWQTCMYTTIQLKRTRTNAAVNYGYSFVQLGERSKHKAMLHETTSCLCHPAECCSSVLSLSQCSGCQLLVDVNKIASRGMALCLLHSPSFRFAHSDSQNSSCQSTAGNHNFLDPEVDMACTVSLLQFPNYDDSAETVS